MDNKDARIASLEKDIRILELELKIAKLRSELDAMKRTTYYSGWSSGVAPYNPTYTLRHPRRPEILRHHILRHRHHGPIGNLAQGDPAQ